VKPTRGRVYRLQASLGARAQAALVLSEDDWNRVMGDSVVVPLYATEPVHPGALRPKVGALWSDCTLLGGVDQELLGEDLGAADSQVLLEVGAAVRLYLDLDALIEPPRVRRPPTIGRSEWWPRRGEIHYGRRFGEQRERYGVITDDDWNVRNDYAACVFITSRFKQWRTRWQIPLASGGHAIAGDIEPFSYTELDARNRPPAGERQLSREDLQALARGLALVLAL
jgi:mRNA-degrading endonuclease toxin of MazEF toxin-antitoxin module